MLVYGLQYGQRWSYRTAMAAHAWHWAPLSDSN